MLAVQQTLVVDKYSYYSWLSWLSDETDEIVHYFLEHTVEFDFAENSDLYMQN